MAAPRTSESQENAMKQHLYSTFSQLSNEIHDDMRSENERFQTLAYEHSADLATEALEVTNKCQDAMQKLEGKVATTMEANQQKAITFTAKLKTDLTKQLADHNDAMQAQLTGLETDLDALGKEVNALVGKLKEIPYGK